jgi:putative flippase GtrA
VIARMKPLLQRHRQLVLYALIGGSGALLDLLVYVVLTSMFSIEPVVATILSVSIGIVNNFLLNTFLNFKVRTRLWLRFLSFYSIGLVGVVLSALVIWIFTELVDLGYLWAKVISIPPVVVGQFIANKNITFARRADISVKEDLDGVRAE